jgi:hypothetical protein
MSEVPCADQWTKLPPASGCNEWLTGDDWILVSAFWQDVDHYWRDVAYWKDGITNWVKI